MIVRYMVVGFPAIPFTQGLDVVLSLIHKIVGGVLCLSRGIRDRGMCYDVVSDE